MSSDPDPVRGGRGEGQPGAVGGGNLGIPGAGRSPDGPRPGAETHRHLLDGVRRWGAWALGAIALALGVGWLAPFAASSFGPGGFVEPGLGLLHAPGFVLTLGAGLIVGGLWTGRRWSASDRVLYLGPGMLVLAGAAGTAGPFLERIGYVLGSGLVVVWFTFVLQHIYRHKQLEASTTAYLREAAVLAVVASAGWFLWALNGVAVAWALTGPLAAVVLARGVVSRPRAVPEPRVPWLLRPGWTVQLLLFTFLSEFFVGALLDFELAGRGFLGYIPFVPVSGPIGTVVGLEVYDGLWFGAAILASAWFLVALGITMGGLVVLRMRDVHVPAQRYRMGLMVAVYGLAAVYIPSLASSTPLVPNRVLASLPVIGWGFGLRSGGPFESGIFLAVIVMYATVGVLTVLFGRKALCSVMCGAALIYQGSTMHEMRAFNQRSRVGQYFLGSRLSTAYVVASSLALGSLFAVSLLAAVHRLPMVQIANGEYDTAALPLPVELYFGGLWFAMFISTPYIGTYNCATTGVCHWGSLSVPFARVSLFRLRVKDRSVCQRCTTFDCAKSCPVGLVDMPLHFRTTGEFRSTKCCGVGDCIGACPYGNMYQQDVRWAVARLFARRPRSRRGTPLPMVSTPAGSAAPPSGAAASRAE